MICKKFGKKFVIRLIVYTLKMKNKNKQQANTNKVLGVNTNSIIKIEAMK
jgi:hypothetical protein